MAPTRLAVSGSHGFIGRHVMAQCPNAVRLPRELSLLKEWAISSECRTVIHLGWAGLPHFESLSHVAELGRQVLYLQELSALFDHVIVAGTCLEYGLCEGELSEEMPTSPTTPYGAAKDTLRHVIGPLVEFTWARLFYIYGDDQRPNALYPQLKAAAETHGTLKMGNPDYQRDYLHVDAVAAFLVALANQPPAGVVNVCSGVGRPLREIVQHWVNENNWRVNLQFGERPKCAYEPDAFWGSRAKLDRVLAPVACL